VGEFERLLGVRRSGVFLFVMSHLVPEMFGVFVLCRLGADDVMGCDGVEVEAQSGECLCKW